jgi:hypothetical protein
LSAKVFGDLDLHNGARAYGLTEFALIVKTTGKLSYRFVSVSTRGRQATPKFDRAELVTALHQVNR